MPGTPLAEFLSRPTVQQAKVRLRRLMKEGFDAYLLSVSLVTTGAILVNLYIHAKADLDEAVREGILRTVSTLQEPTDAAKELGLIGFALANPNATSLPVERCPNTQIGCAPFDDLPKQLAADIVSQIAKEPLGSLDQWSNKNLDIDQVKDPAPLSWPELGEVSLCQKMTDGTYSMFPVQMRNVDPKQPLFGPRTIRAAKVSDYLGPSLDRLRAVREDQRSLQDFVQAYYISPDSFLRIWSSRDTNFCSSEEFPKSRLWAAKSYFSEFWERPADAPPPTRAYVDYGGNGLVRTTCHVLELPKDQGTKEEERTGFPRGELLGIVCMDFRLPEDQNRLKRRQLFFETAVVTFPYTETADLEGLSVTNLGADDSTEPRTASDGQPQPNTAATISGQPNPTAVNGAGQPAPQSAEQRAIKMQGDTLDGGALRLVLQDQLRNVNPPRSLLRDVTRIGFKGGKAFVLPLGVYDRTFHGLIFYPRSPTLHWFDYCFGMLGFALIGAGVASGGFSWRLQPKATELRDRISLFRNLQVGIIQVDQSDWIIESNDRAEELFGRKLPKPGVKGQPVNLADLIGVRVRESLQRKSADEPTYERIAAEDVQQMRGNGEASSYYALLDDLAQHKWLCFWATPIMAAHTSQRKTNEVRWRGVFATITEVSAETGRALDQFLET
jgi:hypothetical protein